MKSTKIIDRVAYAAKLSAGKCVLDIGGQKMEGTPPNCRFARAYSKIQQSTKEYKIVDYQNKSTVDYVVDFNKPKSIPEIRRIITEFKPDVILCMELLEHVNYHFELMNELARAIKEHNSEIFITVPNNGNWIINLMGWNRDHSISFLKGVAERFIKRSDLGQHHVQMFGCLGKYHPAWPIIYTLAGAVSWGFRITK